MPRILASADIGSNTVHLLVAEVDGDLMSRISDTNEWISLGEVVGRQKKIPPALADRLIKTLDTFRKHAASTGAEGIYVFGTEAIRNASNQEQVLKAIRMATGIKVEIITGRREAELGLRGAWLDGQGHGSFLLTEVGGGSAQVASCSVNNKGKPTIGKESSLPIGTGTLIAKLGLDGPCTDHQYQELMSTIDRALDELDLTPGRRLLACGGVARGVWKSLHPDGERVVNRAELEYLVWAARRLAPDVLVDRFSVKPKRAATLLPGAAVYHAVMRRSEVEEMTVSRFGVREGAILEMSDGHIEPSRV